MTGSGPTSTLLPLFFSLAFTVYVMSSVPGHDSTEDDKKELRLSQIVDNKKKNGGLGAVALIFACGTALFSDGYVNANSGPTNTILSIIYSQDKYADQNLNLTHFSSLYSSMTFAGTLLGMIVFGVLSDRIGRKFGMLFASVWLSLWSVIAAGAYGAGGSINGMFAALEAYRFLLGIAIGAEYPAGSVAASENTEGAGVNPRRQQMYFVLATNTMIGERGEKDLYQTYIYQLINTMNRHWICRCYPSRFDSLQHLWRQSPSMGLEAHNWSRCYPSICSFLLSNEDG